MLSAARSHASSIANGDLRRACEQIIDEVVHRVSAQNIGNWTFRDFATWVNRDPADALLQASLAILADSHGTPILEMHFLFYDPTDEDPMGDVIPDEDVQEAFRVGYLINPHTGYPLDHFERYLAPFFSPASRLAEELLDRRISRETGPQSSK